MRRLAVLATLAACNIGPPPGPPPDDVAAGGSAHATPGGSAIAPSNGRVDPWANPKPPPPAPLTTNDMKPLPYIEFSNPSAAEPAPRPTVFGPAPRPPAPHTIVAPPSQAMRALAVAPDGTAAVSADIGGSARLWPTLDGTHEPVIVPMRRPVALAITHAGAQVAILGIDGAGQLELVVTGVLGESPVRRPIALPRPATAVHAITRGFLVERDDQHLVFVAPGGQLLGDVEPPPGTHVAAIAVQGDAMFAVLAGGGAVHGRWLSVEGGLHWGDETGALPIEPRAVALTPNHKAIAAIQHDDKTSRLVLVGLAHGDVLAQGRDLGFIDPGLQPVGFLDATSVLVRFSGFTMLWHTDEPDGDTTELSEERRMPLAAVAGAQAVFGSGANLTLIDRDGTTRYLGFRIGTLSTFAPGARTLLATDGQHVVRLGTDLRDHASYDLPELKESGYNVMALLDANHVLVQSYSRDTYYEVIALETMEAATQPLYERFSAYDVHSHIAAFITTGKIVFRRFAGKTGTFGNAAELEAKDPSSVVLDGDRAIITAYRDDTTYNEQTITHIKPEAGTLKIESDRQRQLQMSAEGGFIPPTTVAFSRSATSPDGALVATLSAGRISLRDTGGATRWTVAANGAFDVIWLRSGELLATGAGLARVDLESGAFTDRRCGWQFGLWNDRIDSFASAQMCEAE
ncbi:MAG: hypothetical protein JO257_04715 [Deltaproteobacteria bacterium]|nr:hypothetical protein [Deltaproteobacteria bacterium]